VVNAINKAIKEQSYRVTQMDENQLPLDFGDSKYGEDVIGF